jgi:hypothetical protein
MSRYSQRGTVCVGSRVRTKVKPRFVAIALICCALSLSTWLSVQWRTRPNPQDFEQCSEKAETIASKDERASLIAQCDAQFVGRRRIGGGYTYYDFLQNRQFDIAGPNPTSKELKHFDEEYALYLSAQRKEAKRGAHCRTAKCAIRFSKRSIFNGPYIPAGATHGDHPD